MNLVKRIYIWCRRFRYRCGYGVQSPTAFSFIVDVIYQKTPYYAYASLDRQRVVLLRGKYKDSLKLDRLLFRLANEFRPQCITEYAPASLVARYYLCAGCKIARYNEILESSSLNSILANLSKIDLLHMGMSLYTEDILEKSLSLIHEHSIIIMDDIYKDKSAKRLWDKIRKDERVVTSFDLYEVGLLMFLPRINKQHYVVNF